MKLKEIIDTDHKNLTLDQILIKSYYINELLRLNPEFDTNVRNLMFKSIKNLIIPNKRVTLADFSPEELLDLTNPLTI